jgi:hypothetical protein
MRTLFDGQIYLHEQITRSLLLLMGEAPEADDRDSASKAADHIITTLGLIVVGVDGDVLTITAGGHR